MIPTDHYPSDFEMADDMAEFAVEHAAELAALDRKPTPEGETS